MSDDTPYLDLGNIDWIFQPRPEGWQPPQWANIGVAPPPEPARVTRSMRHRLQRRFRLHWQRIFIPVVSPELDRLRAAAHEPCWRESEEGHDWQHRLTTAVDRAFPLGVQPDPEPTNLPVHQVPLYGQPRETS